QQKMGPVRIQDKRSRLPPCQRKSHPSVFKAFGSKRSGSDPRGEVHCRGSEKSERETACEELSFDGDRAPWNRRIYLRDPLVRKPHRTAAFCSRCHPLARVRFEQSP